jgi:hypothetical protein
MAASSFCLRNFLILVTVFFRSALFIVVIASSPDDVNGAAEGTRTLDIQLGKLTLYQLSYSRSQGSVKLLAGGEDSAECAGQEGLRVFEKN